MLLLQLQQTYEFVLHPFTERNLFCATALSETVGYLRWLIKLHKGYEDYRKLEVTINSPLCNLGQLVSAALQSLVLSLVTVVPVSRATVLSVENLQLAGTNIVFISADLKDFFNNIDLQSMLPVVFEAIDKFFNSVFAAQVLKQSIRFLINSKRFKML